MKNTWRDRCAPIIEKVLKETKGQGEAEVKKALFDAYPFGMRQYHPYKIWLSEIRRQRGIKSKPKKIAQDINQERMF